MFQIEMTYRAIRDGFRVVEVPITFADRQLGGSKMSRSIVLEAVRRVPRAAARRPSASSSEQAFNSRCYPRAACDA